MDTLSQFIFNHWALWLALAIILVLIFINEALSQQKRANELSTTEAVGAMNNEHAVIFDIREKEAYRSGHIINAININSDDELSQKRIEKYKNKPVIVVCVKGLQARTFAAKLKAQGFSKPLVLSGGMTAWTQAGLPVEKGNN